MHPLAAEIIAIGDEVLNGEIVNSNASHIATRLNDAGWRVIRHTVIADDADAILAAFAEADARARVVIVSGGLGPTRDDITSECAARFFGVERVLDEDVLERIRAFFERVGYPMSENNRSQAMFPRGAVVLPNPEGTAPGFRMSRDGKHFFFVPGVPREMKRMLDREILPFLDGVLPPGLTARRSFCARSGWANRAWTSGSRTRRPACPASRSASGPSSRTTSCGSSRKGRTAPTRRPASRASGRRWRRGSGR